MRPREPDLEQARRIHAVCEEFEARWRSGDQNRIEDVLEQADEGDRCALLDELLILEVELRRDRGEGPSLGEYRARFPAAEGRVATAFAMAAGGDYGPSKTVTLVDGSATAALPDHSAVGAIFGSIGDYQILEEIARGGMGVVYKARQHGANRLVAIKMILSGQMASADERERFLREAELAANLDHQNIIPIYEVAEFQGCPFFSMKLVEGESLADQIKARRRSASRLDPRAAAHLMATIARAVQYAHERGFLHCDLKPSNILLDREGPPLRHRLWPGQAGQRG